MSQTPAYPPNMPNPPLNYAAPGQFEFRSSAGRATVAKILLMVVMVLTVAVVALDRIMTATGVYEDLDADRLSSRGTILVFGMLGAAVLWLLAYIGAIIAVCMWMHRAHRNTFALAVKRPRFSSGWAVGYWFIPIMNLFRPYQAMQDVYDGSHPSAAGERGRSIVGWWWAAWLIGNILDRISSRVEASGAMSTTLIDIASTALNVLAGVMLIWLISRIVQHQAQTVLAAPANVGG